MSEKVKGPESYFPSIEQKYGRPIEEWKNMIRASDLAKHPGAVKSPMVGTAYLSPEPGKPAFVNVGDKVTAGQTVLIIEAMKTFNPIKAPKAGTLTQILVENGQPVEYGHSLMVIG